MATHVISNSNENQGFPMFFKTIPTKNGLIIHFAHNKVVQVNDKIRLHPDPKMPSYQIVDILEQREPAIATEKNPNNVNHFPKGVTFYRLQTIS